MTSLELVISNKLILGTWGLAGPVIRQGKELYYGKYHEQESLAVIDAAWKFGIRYVDTASSYGDGNCFELLHKWQCLTQKKFSLVIKPGRPIQSGRPKSNFIKSHLLKEITQANKLSTHPEIILLKDPPLANLPTKKLHTLFEFLQKQFQQARVGLASHLLFECKQLDLCGLNRIAQIEFNGINYHQAQDTIKHLKQKHWEIWAMQPLAYGFLSGKYTQDYCFPKNDWRYYLAKEKQLFLTMQAQNFLLNFTEFVEHKYSPSMIALAFCLLNPSVDKVVVGPKTIAQINDLVKVNELVRDQKFIQVVSKILAKGIKIEQYN